MGEAAYRSYRESYSRTEAARRWLSLLELGPDGQDETSAFRFNG